MHTERRRLDGKPTDGPPAISAEDYFQYLEQDERMLASISATEEAKMVHLKIAEHYHQLATRARN